MKQFNYSKGKNSEEKAKNFLIEKGYGYVDSNWEVEKGEIDLIMSDRGWLVFVEVKYKSDDFMGRPEEMIGRRKLAQVRRIAEIYLLRNPKIREIYKKYRIDAVCILGDKISHYENIY